MKIRGKSCILAGLFLLVISIAVYATVDTTKPWHPMQQIAIYGGSTTGIDNNNDMVIDIAEKCGKNGICEVKNTAGDAKIIINRTGGSYSSLDFFVNGIGRWGLGASGNNFYIDKTGSPPSAFFIDYATKNVGISTTSPTQKLDVAGQVRATDVCTTGGVCLSTVSGSGLWTDAGSYTYLTSTTDNVGIGTTNPGSYKLYVSGNIGVSGTVDGYDISAYGPYFISSAGSSGQVWTSDGSGAGYWGSGGGGGGGWTDDGSVVRLTTSTDYVGIGTTGPNKPLEISKTADANIRLTDSDGTNAAAYLEFYDASTRLGYIGLPGNAAEDLVIASESGKDIILSPAGNVGIGTTGPGQKLDVQGGNIKTSGQLFTNNYGSLPNGWNGIHTWDIHARASVRTAMLCLGGGWDSDTLGDCRTAWPSEGGLAGSGTTNYVAKWTGATSLGNSVIYDNGANVGIGTTNPNAKLDVYGDIMSDGSNMWIFHTPDDGRTSLYFGRGSNGGIAEWPIEFKAGGGAYFAGNVGIGTTGPGQLLELYKDNADVALRFHDPNTAWFTVGLDYSDGSKFKINRGGSLGDNTDFTIDSNTGNVGIGTASPGYKLDVSGNFRAGAGSRVGNHDIYSDQIELTAAGSGNRYSFIDFHGDDTYADFGLRILRGNSGANAWSEISHRGTGGFYISAVEAAPIVLRTSNNDRVIIDSAGNVGIGTWPGVKLHINDNVGGTTPAFQVDRNGWTAFFSQLPAGAYNGLVTTNDKALIFSDGAQNTGNLVIGPWGSAYGIKIQGSTGNVGIGTSSPQAKLQVEGSGFFRGDTGALSTSAGKGVRIFYATSYDAGMIFAYDYGAGVAKNLLIPYGNVGIGTASPSQKLDVAGNVKISGDITEVGNICLDNGCKSSWGFPPPDYDSGWVPINPGQEIVLNHNLNTPNTMVYIEARNVGTKTLPFPPYTVVPDLDIHIMRMGFDDTSGDHQVGFYWRAKRLNSITIYRGGDDSSADQIRIHMWRIG